MRGLPCALDAVGSVHDGALHPPPVLSFEVWPKLEQLRHAPVKPIALERGVRRPPCVPRIGLGRAEPEERVVVHRRRRAHPPPLRRVVAVRAVDRPVRARPRHRAQKFGEYVAVAPREAQMQPEDAPPVVVRACHVRIRALKVWHRVARPLIGTAQRALMRCPRWRS